MRRTAGLPTSFAREATGSSNRVGANPTPTRKSPPAGRSAACEIEPAALALPCLIARSPLAAGGQPSAIFALAGSVAGLARRRTARAGAILRRAGNAQPGGARGGVDGAIAAGHRGGQGACPGLSPAVCQGAAGGHHRSPRAGRSPPHPEIRSDRAAAAGAAAPRPSPPRPPPPRAGPSPPPGRFPKGKAPARVFSHCAGALFPADLGLIAYESTGPDGEVCPGMVLDEGIILELVHPGTGDPVAPGEVGEVVVTTLTPEYPLIRFATGDLSALLHGASPCGRTNHRIKGWLGRADQTAKVRGMFVHPAQVAEIVRRHKSIIRARLVVERPASADQMTLLVEMGEPAETASAIAETAQSVTKLRAEVTRVPEGSLPNDGKVIEDRRPIG